MFALVLFTISSVGFRAVNNSYYIATLRDALNLTSVLFEISVETYSPDVAEMSVIALHR